MAASQRTAPQGARPRFGTFSFERTPDDGTPGNASAFRKTRSGINIRWISESFQNPVRQTDTLQFAGLPASRFLHSGTMNSTAQWPCEADIHSEQSGISRALIDGFLLSDRLERNRT